MKKNFINKYFLLSLVVVVLIFNLILFLLVNSYKKELFKNPSFWVLYGCVMLIFVVLALLTFIKNTHLVHQNLYLPMILPSIMVGLIGGFILFFFVQKIKVVIILIPYLIIFGIMIISFILGSFYQNHLNGVKSKTTLIISMNGLKEFLNNLINNTSDTIYLEFLNDLMEKSDIEVKDEDNIELKELEKRIFEYALFIKKDIEENSKNNFIMNATKLKELLIKRGNY